VLCGGKNRICPEPVIIKKALEVPGVEKDEPDYPFSDSDKVSYGLWEKLKNF